MTMENNLNYIKTENSSYTAEIEIQIHNSNLNVFQMKRKGRDQWKIFGGRIIKKNNLTNYELHIFNKLHTKIAREFNAPH